MSRCSPPTRRPREPAFPLRCPRALRGYGRPRQEEDLPVGLRDGPRRRARGAHRRVRLLGVGRRQAPPARARGAPSPRRGPRSAVGPPGPPPPLRPGRLPPPPPTPP